MKLKLNSKYTVAIIISLIIGASILGYGYMDYRYKKEALEQKIKSEKQAKLDKLREEGDRERLTTTKQQQLQNCLDEVSERYKNAVKGKNNVPYEEVKIFIEFYQKQRDECFRKYPQ